MIFKKGLVSLILLVFSGNALAHCEKERAELEEWNTKFQQLSSASCAAGIFGGIFAVVTVGASMAPCGALIASAANADRIRHEKEANLRRCVEQEKKRQKQAEVARKQKEAEKAKKLKEEIELAEARRKDAEKLAAEERSWDGYYAALGQLSKEVEDFTREWVAEGYSIEGEDFKKELRNFKMDRLREIGPPHSELVALARGDL